MTNYGHWSEFWPIAAFLFFCTFLVVLGPASRSWARNDMRRIDRKRLKEWERQRGKQPRQKPGV